MKNKSFKYIFIGIIALIILGIGIYAIRNVFPTVNATLEISNALQPVIEAENQKMHVQMDAGVDDNQIQIDADVYLLEEDAMHYMVLKQNEYALYIIDNVLFLENGKAFLLIDDEGKAVTEDENSDKMNLTDLLPIISTVFEEFEISRMEKENEISYQVEVTGEQVQKLLQASMMSEQDVASDIEKIDLMLVTKDSKLSSIQMCGYVTAEESRVTLDLMFSEFEELKAGEHEIPQIIKDSVETVDKDALFCITEDVYRLIKAVEPLSKMESQKGTVELNVNCGLLKVNTSIGLDELQQLVSNVSDKSGENEIQNPEAIQELPKILGGLLMEADITCVERNGGYVYALTLDQTTMESLAQTIMPEMMTYAVNYESGKLELVMEDDWISTITVEITGSMNALITKIPVSLGVTFVFED